MPLQRFYDRPGMPGGILRIPNFKKMKTNYSLELKALALQGFADRVPEFPGVCPRCAAVYPSIVVQCGFKVGIAGAVVFICRACQQPHIPVQPGPSEEHLSRIEEQRKSDTEETRARNAANALVTYAKKGRTRGGIPAHLTKSAQLLFRNPVPDGEGGIREGHPLPTVGAVGAVTARLEVVLFYKAGDAPVTRADSMRGDGKVYLSDYQWLLPYCEETHVYVFERWEIFAHRWITIPHATASFEIPHDVDTIFLRVWGLNCYSLGRELRRYDEKHNTDLLPTDRISSYIHEVIDGNFWLVAWTKPGDGPTVVSLTRSVSQRRSEIHVQDWFEGHGIKYWVEKEYTWEPFPPARGEALKLMQGTNAVLLRRADILRVLGFGDALECLERTRRLRDTARYAVDVLGLNAPQLGDVLAPHLTHMPIRRAAPLAVGAPDAHASAATRARPEASRDANVVAARAPADGASTRWRAKVAPGGFRIIYEGEKEVIDVSED